MANNIIGTFCIWCDLLGYSTPFINSNWDLNNEKALKNYERIASLQYVFTSYLFYPVEKTLVLNDGFSRTLDLVKTDGGYHQYIYWLNDVLNSFSKLNYIDKKNNFPGARAVLTYGHRFQYMKDNIRASDFVLTSEQKRNKLEKDVLVYSLKEFQMNTAFSKAYIIEGAGSKAGIVGSNLYIDLEFLTSFEKILTNESSYYLLADQDNFIELNENEFKYNLGKVEVVFNIEKRINDEYLEWDIYQEIDAYRDLLFRLYFDKVPVEFKEKGIDTILYRAVKFKPFDEDLDNLIFL